MKAAKITALVKPVKILMTLSVGWISRVGEWLFRYPQALVHTIIGAIAGAKRIPATTGNR